MKPSVMVILSGGQDSSTCLLEAKKQYAKVHAITFDYGQRHSRELSCAKVIAAMCHVQSHTILEVKHLLRSRSPLTDHSVPLEKYTDFGSMDKIIGDRVELTFVPLRNPLFLLAAANHALANDCFTLMTGVCEMDNANYPDCTSEFLVAMENMMQEALGMLRPSYVGPVLTVEAPLLHLSKADTVRLAMTHGELGRRVMANSHTCYAGEYPPCGTCHSCTLRAEGFKLAGADDPLVTSSRS